MTKVPLCTCVVDSVHWHLYPPVNLWANVVLVHAMVKTVKIHEHPAHDHECLGRKDLRHDVC